MQDGHQGYRLAEALLARRTLCRQHLWPLFARSPLARHLPGCSGVGTRSPSPRSGAQQPSDDSAAGAMPGRREGSGGKRTAKRKKAFKLCSAYAAPATVPVLQRVAAKLGWEAVDRAEAGAGEPSASCCQLLARCMPANSASRARRVIGSRCRSDGWGFPPLPLPLSWHAGLYWVCQKDKVVRLVRDLPSTQLIGRYPRMNVFCNKVGEQAPGRQPRTPLVPQSYPDAQQRWLRNELLSGPAPPHRYPSPTLCNRPRPSSQTTLTSGRAATCCRGTSWR